MRSHHARFTTATLDKRTECGMNPHSFGLHGPIYLLGPEPRAALGHATPLYTALRDSEERSRIHRGINNISVKYREKHSNSVKATDIRTNATDVETRRNIVQ